jgi:hypothetical protein
MTTLCECEGAPPSLLMRLTTAILKVIYAWPYKPPMTVEELSFRLREDLNGPRHLRW